MKDDTVSRAAAIDEAEEWIEVVYCEDGDQRERDAIGHVIHGIKELPSVQTCEDAVSRQQAIDALDRIGSLDTEADKKYARSVFEALPSVQPQQIVRCKDCKHADDDGVCQNSVGLVIQDDDDFCSKAERRTDGSD